MTRLSATVHHTGKKLKPFTKFCLKVKSNSCNEKLLTVLFGVYHGIATLRHSDFKLLMKKGKKLMSHGS